MMLEYIEIETATNPSATVIWLHGLGADGGDFVPIVRELDLTGCPAIRFIFPHAPTIPVTVNNGYRMRAWYDILGGDITQRQDEIGLRKSQQSVEELIAAENSRGVPTERIVLAGFSQGCAMALQTGLRHPRKLAGLLCLSGYLPLADAVAAQRNIANQHTSIFLAHGRTDTVIPIDRALSSRDVLLQLGYDVEWHEYSMPHSLCPQETHDIGTWIRRVLCPNAV
ncbi:MAG: alpha/beta hydrolase [Burkholderiaceae bacterium]